MFTLDSLLLTSGCVAMTTHVRPVLRVRAHARVLHVSSQYYLRWQTFHTRVSKDAGEGVGVEGRSSYIEIKKRSGWRKSNK